MKTDRVGYVLTSEGWKPAPLIKYEPPKWYHKVLSFILRPPFLALVKCLEWLERMLKYE